MMSLNNKFVVFVLKKLYLCKNLKIRNMKQHLITGLILVFSFLFAQADEGMWLPYLLKSVNEKEMQAEGLRIAADDIYNVNKTSLKDAVVLFGSGCTGVLVSEQGLLLTNHHCGYGHVQQHSSLENNYLANGFWAMNKEEELPNPKLTCTMLVSMEEVTSQVLNGVTNNMTEAERNKKIEENSKKIIQKATAGTHYTAMIKPIYNGNQYLLFVNEVFKDIRLVGAPPSNIGKFGGDTDNWMWPRHTGDFSVFRIYVGKDGKPAEYSKDNVPYKPKTYIPISLKGIEEDDFTFVFGYPGTTQQFVPSYAVDLIENQINPIAIELRTKRLDIIQKYMNNDELCRIQYATKAANIANSWKKWIGENKGLKRLNTVENKKKLEEDFRHWISQNETRKQYNGILPAYESLYKQIADVSKSVSFHNEAFNAAESVRFAWRFNQLINKAIEKDTTFSSTIKEQISVIELFFKDYNPDLDKELFIETMTYYITHIESSKLPQKTIDLLQKYQNNPKALADAIYANSVFFKKEELKAIMEKESHSEIENLKNDPLFQWISPVFENYTQTTQKQILALNIQQDSLNRLWTKALMEMQSPKTFYPDANLTLRVTYGKVKGYQPMDGVTYKYYTTIEGIMQKENPDIYDYVVEDKLKALYSAKDYGRYAMKNGEMPVAFVATNHTTGGNSGSPILNGDGHLIGLNFDRCWEGTMSDIQYDPDQCRNISIDIRYCLFIIDKFAGAKHLLDEMTVVE